MQEWQADIYSLRSGEIVLRRVRDAKVRVKTITSSRMRKTRNNDILQSYVPEEDVTAQPSHCMEALHHFAGTSLKLSSLFDL